MPTNKDAGGDSNASQDSPPPTLPPSIKGNENGKGNNGKNGRQQIATDDNGPPHWTRYVEAACAILLVLITGTYTYYSSKQARAAADAADAAKGAVTVASNTLAETQASNTRQALISEKIRLSSEKGCARFSASYNRQL